MENLKEKLSNLCHEQWSGWMDYLFKCSKFNPDGTVTIPKWAVDRWTKQLTTSYNNLSEEEKNSDRTEADKFIKLLKENSGQISDGYHTFDDLYEHRIVLFIKLCEIIEDDERMWDYKHKSVWRSKKHSDNSSFDNWFIMGINKEKGEQISYHLPLKYWESTNFAETLESAPEWDGHTSNDVIKRLLEL